MKEIKMRTNDETINFIDEIKCCEFAPVDLKEDDNITTPMFNISSISNSIARDIILYSNNICNSVTENAHILRSILLSSIRSRVLAIKYLISAEIVFKNNSPELTDEICNMLDCSARKLDNYVTKGYYLSNPLLEYTALYDNIRIMLNEISDYNAKTRISVIKSECMFSVNGDGKLNAYSIENVKREKVPLNTSYSVVVNS